MRMPVAAQRDSIPVALAGGECAVEDFSAVMVWALKETAMVCHLRHLTTSRAASEGHSAVPRPLAGNTVRGGRRWQTPCVRTIFVPAGYFLRLPEIFFARRVRRGDRDASKASGAKGRGRDGVRPPQSTKSPPHLRPCAKPQSRSP